MASEEFYSACRARVLVKNVPVWRDMVSEILGETITPGLVFPTIAKRWDSLADEQRTRLLAALMLLSEPVST